MNQELLRRAQAFHRQIGGANPHRKRFTPAQRQEGGELCVLLRDAGMTQPEIQACLGISLNSVHRWLHAPSSAKQGALVPVVLEAQPVPCCRERFVLVSPSGWRVEGLGLSDLAELMQRDCG